MDEDCKALLKQLPKIDELMLFLDKRGDMGGMAPEIVKTLCRTEVEMMRQSILDGDEAVRETPLSLEAVAARVARAVRDLNAYRLRRVINATGVILHTNLGRAPLCKEAVARIVEVSGGYSNLEYDLAKGERGLRYDHIRELVCRLTGAEDALVVNNNAAAVLLVLNTLAQGRESVVSRGELVEVGGEFRIPDVMERSGSRLREVGATNRTRLADYESAINPETALLLKVHTSNFRIIGFTEEASLAELVALGARHAIPVMDDLGSGCFVDLAPFGLEREPTVSEVVKSGVDVVTFSGDKLLGGAQAGLIVGKRSVLEKIRKNPLTRALRIDKLTLAALEATLMLYLDPREARRKIPVLKALTEPVADVMKRARRMKALLQKLSREDLSVSIASGDAAAGGGSLPGQNIPTALVGVVVRGISSSGLEMRLRALDIPVIARVEGDRVFLDMRTVMDHELQDIRDGLLRILAAV